MAWHGGVQSVEDERILAYGWVEKCSPTVSWMVSTVKQISSSDTLCD
jgi:hypothetical protein